MMEVGLQVDLTERPSATMLLIRLEFTQGMNVATVVDHSKDAGSVDSRATLRIDIVTTAAMRGENGTTIEDCMEPHI